jgi:hypothetical protein
MFGDKVSVALGPDFPDSDVLPGVLHVLLVEPHDPIINPFRPMGEDGRLETDDERHFAGEVWSLFGWWPSTSSTGTDMPEGTAVGVVNDIWVLIPCSGNSVRVVTGSGWRRRSSTGTAFGR